MDMFLFSPFSREFGSRGMLGIFVGGHWTMNTNIHNLVTLDKCLFWLLIALVR